MTSRLELGAPSFEERLEMVREMAKIVKRVVVRCQPYVPALHSEIKSQIPRIADAGAYGIIYEALKLTVCRDGMIKNGADFVYPYLTLKNKFTDLKETCHKHQMTFLCGENRLRSMGDSLCCCGCEGLAGFQPSTCNLNHYIYDREHFAYTAAMSIRGTAECFKAMGQDTKTSLWLRENSFESVMGKYLHDEKAVRAFVDKE